MDSPGPSLSNSVASLTQSNNVDSTATPTRPGSAFHRGTSRSGRATPARSESRNNVKRSSSSSDGPLSLIGKLDALKMAQANPGSPSINGDSSNEEKSNPPVGFNATVDRIIFDHLEALKGAVQSEEIRQQVSDDIVDDCERLRDFLMAAKVSFRRFIHPTFLYPFLASFVERLPPFSYYFPSIALRFIFSHLNSLCDSNLNLNGTSSPPHHQIIEEISPRSQDIIIGVGERLSCRIVVGALLDAGVDAELVTLESIVDSAFLESAGLQGAGEEAQLGQVFYDKLAERLGERLRQCKGMPVVTGE